MNPWPLPYQGNALPLSYVGWLFLKAKAPKFGTINSRNSILLLINLSGWPGSNRRPTAWKAVALPTELHPLKIYKNTWGEKDSNLRRRKSTDLQSVPVGHFGIPPKNTLFHRIPMKRIAKLYGFSFYSNIWFKIFENTFISCRNFICFLEKWLKKYIRVSLVSSHFFKKNNNSYRTSLR